MSNSSTADAKSKKRKVKCEHVGHDMPPGPPALCRENGIPPGYRCGGRHPSMLCKPGMCPLYPIECNSDECPGCESLSCKGPCLEGNQPSPCEESSEDEDAECIMSLEDLKNQVLDAAEFECSEIDWENEMMVDVCKDCSGAKVRIVDMCTCDERYWDDASEKAQKLSESE